MYNFSGPVTQPGYGRTSAFNPLTNPAFTGFASLYEQQKAANPVPPAPPVQDDNPAPLTTPASSYSPGLRPKQSTVIPQSAAQQQQAQQGSNYLQGSTATGGASQALQTLGLPQQQQQQAQSTFAPQQNAQQRTDSREGFGQQGQWQGQQQSNPTQGQSSIPASWAAFGTGGAQQPWMNGTGSMLYQGNTQSTTPYSQQSWQPGYSPGGSVGSVGGGSQTEPSAFTGYV